MSIRSGLVVVLSVVAMTILAAGLATAAPNPPPPDIDKSIPDIGVAPPQFETPKVPDKPADKPADKAQKPGEPNKDSKPGNSNYNGGFGDGVSKPASTPERNKLLKEIEAQLAAITPLGSKKREADDLYVLGTVEVTKKHQVTVEYVIERGVKAAAVKVVDFLLRDPTAVHKWQTFARVKNTKAAEKQLALAKAKSIESQVAAIPLDKPKRGKRADDDSFVAGTADLRLSDKHADVRFRVLTGVKTVADFLLDYVLAAPGGVKREWHIFYRARSEDDANKYVEQLRKWYDDMETQREALAQIYEAASTSRC